MSFCRVAPSDLVDKSRFRLGLSCERACQWACSMWTLSHNRTTRVDSTILIPTVGAAINSRDILISGRKEPTALKRRVKWEKLLKNRVCAVYFLGTWKNEAI